MYHDGARHWQDRFETRALADRLVEVTLHTQFTDQDRQLIEGCTMFFLATADAGGRPECSFKGGPPGFVRVLPPDALAFPSYDGNGMFKSLGNILVNPNVGLLFVDFDRQRRVRVNGTATAMEYELSDLRAAHQSRLKGKAIGTEEGQNADAAGAEIREREHSRSGRIQLPFGDSDHFIF